MLFPALAASIRSRAPARSWNAEASAGTLPSRNGHTNAACAWGLRFKVPMCATPLLAKPAPDAVAFPLP